MGSAILSEPLDDAAPEPEAPEPKWVDTVWREFPESSNVKALRLMPHHTTPTLCHVQARFKTGAVYEYNEVPRALMDEAVEAASIGRWFQSNVVGGPYGYAKIEDPDVAEGIDGDGEEEEDYG